MTGLRKQQSFVSLIKFIGVTEQSDAIALAVSEETGDISIAKEGQIQLNVTLDELERNLRAEFEQ